MKLIFNLEQIKYLKLTYKDNELSAVSMKLAFKEKFEHEIIAVAPIESGVELETPRQVDLDIICVDGLYKTTTTLKATSKDDKFYYYTFQNPATLDYIQNREYFRIYANFDCIYTIETDYDSESYNAETYDISAGGVSIVMDENITAKSDPIILIMMEERNIKSHIKFVRSELFEDRYKLSFEFQDLSENDAEFLEKYCVNAQLNNEA